MFLGTPRKWWIGMALMLVLGFGLLIAPVWGGWGDSVAAVLIVASIATFAAAPMRYGTAARRGSDEPAAPAAQAAPRPPAPARPVAAPYRPARKIEAGDPSDV